MGLAAEKTSEASIKSHLAFRTISEVAAELDLPQHVLRFWEGKFPQIQPTKRRGGRRYYRPEDIKLLLYIRRLLYDDGYTIKGAQNLLKKTSSKPQNNAAPQLEIDTKSSQGFDKSRREKIEKILTELQEIRRLL